MDGCLPRVRYLFILTVKMKGMAAENSPSDTLYTHIVAGAISACQHCGSIGSDIACKLCHRAVIRLKQSLMIVLINSGASTSSTMRQYRLSFVLPVIMIILVDGLAEPTAGICPFDSLSALANHSWTEMRDNTQHHLTPHFPPDSQQVCYSVLVHGSN